MKCIKCGSEIKAGMNFCTNCGTPLQNSAVNNTSPSAAQAVPLGKISFSFTNAKTCKCCGASYESARRKNSYYLIRWLLFGLLVNIVTYLLTALISFIAINADAADSLNLIILASLPAVPLALLHLRYLYDLITNALGITKTPCPVCGLSGEKIFFSRCLSKNPYKKNILTGLTEKVYLAAGRRNIFSAAGIVMAILAFIPIMMNVNFAVMDKSMPMPYLNLTICSIPSMIFAVIGLKFISWGSQMNTMPALRIKRIPLIFSVIGTVSNLISVLCLSKNAVTENLDRLISSRIEITSDMIQVPMTGIKTAVIFISLLTVICMYLSYKTEQFSRTGK